ncbi:hypothetical protein RFI_38680, partial [Reticulomyxa filosa]
MVQVKEASNKDEIDNNVESIERNDKTEESLWTIELGEDWYEITIGANDLINVIGDTVATLKQSDAYKYCDTVIKNETIKETQQWQCSLPPFLIPTDSFPVIIEDSSHFIIDNLHNLLVLHPDCLITPTKISSKNKAMLFGTMAHELFQITLQRGEFGLSLIAKDIDHIITKYMANLLLFFFFDLTKYICKILSTNTKKNTRFAIRENESSARQHLSAF